jgi:hypothetical protein
VRDPSQHKPLAGEPTASEWHQKEGVPTLQVICETVSRSRKTYSYTGRGGRTKTMRIVRLTNFLRLAITLVGVAAALSTLSARARVCASAFGAGDSDGTAIDTTPRAPAVLDPPGSSQGGGVLVLEWLPSLTGQTNDNQSNASQAGGTQTPSSAGSGTQAPSSNAQKTNLAVNPLTGMVPASASDYQPLTGEERWKIYWKMNFLSVGAYFGPFFDALLLDQTTDSPAEWGGGFKGYGRRVASRTADAMLQGTIQAPFAAVLHEDVRYITSTQHGFKRRAVHAIVYSFMTYNNQGHPTLNIANLSAYYGSTAISTVWLPGRYNWASYALSNSTEQIGLTMPVNLIQEFWPEIRHYVFRRH